MGEAVNGVFPMNGFVENYAKAKHATPPVPGSNPPVMGYFSAEQAPVTDFFARNFTVCDHWFSSLPAGTQPNRLMAMSGYTRIDINRTGPIPDQYLVYDWLTDHGIRWRVYHEELPFYSLMPRLIPQIVEAKNFRPFSEFFSDVENVPPREFPQVVFLEPAYTDAPHLGVSSDDHAPSAIKGGQEFLLEVYRAITSDPALWSGMVGVIAYDEHGGFFDHISPPLIPTNPTPDADYLAPFQSLGVRVPALVISPYAQPGGAFNNVLDHTSILKLIGQVFGGGRYSQLVDQRPVGSVLDALVDHGPHAAPVIDSLDDYRRKQAAMAGFVRGATPELAAATRFPGRARLHPGPVREARRQAR
jgi:phospholipase C